MSYVHSINNISLSELPTPIKVDEFKWRNVVQTESFDHTYVLWKGDHILSIRKHVDFNPKTNTKMDGSFDDDSDDEEDEPSSGPRVTWLIHTKWDWLKQFYGEYPTLDAARKAAIDSVTQITAHIRKAFMMKALPHDHTL